VFIETPVPPATSRPQPVTASIWPKDTEFNVPELLQQFLIEAATQSLCLEIETETASKANIVRLWLPGTDR
jgi:hypothetical protein